MAQIWNAPINFLKWYIAWLKRDYSWECRAVFFRKRNTHTGLWIEDGLVMVRKVNGVKQYATPTQDDHEQYRSETAW